MPSILLAIPISIMALASTIVVPVAVGIFHYHRLPQSIRIIFWLQAIGCITELVMGILAWFHTNNLFALHIWGMIELFLLSVYFKFTIRDPWIRNKIMPAALAIIVMAVIYAFAGNNIHNFNSWPRAFEAIILITLSIIVFFEIASSGDSSDPVTSGTFWITGTILFYFIASFITFAFSYYVIENMQYLRPMADTHLLVNAFCNLSFAFGLWISSKSYSSPA